MLRFSNSTAESIRSVEWPFLLPVFEIETEADCVRLVLTVANTEIHVANLYPSDGGVSAWLNGMIREELEVRRLPIAWVKVTVSAGNQAAELGFFVLQCRRNLGSVWTPDEFCRTHFLTLSPTRTLPARASDSVWMVLAPGESKECETVTIWRNPDGSEGKYVSVSGSDLAAEKYECLERQVSWARVPSGATPVLISFSCGDRRCVWYAADAGYCFRFDNTFGVRESFFTRGSVKSKVSVKGSLATIRDRLEAYDREETEEITFTFPPAIPAEMLRIMQISRANEAEWARMPEDPDEMSYLPIVITKSDLDSDEDPDDLPAPSITFNLSDPLPMAGVLPSGRIFRRQYAGQFK